MFPHPSSSSSPPSPPPPPLPPLSNEGLNSMNVESTPLPIVALPSVVTPSNVEDYRCGGFDFVQPSFKIENIGSILRGPWNLDYGMHSRWICDNIYVFQFFHRDDIRKVMDGSPWWYAERVMVMVPVPGVGEVPRHLFNDVAFWIQIHGIPIMHLTEEIGTNGYV